MSPTKPFFLILGLATLSVVASGCAGAKKDISPPYAPVFTAEEIAKDQAQLDELTSRLFGDAGRRFKMKTLANGQRVAEWDPSVQTTISAGVQITALERFVEFAKKYVSKYTLYTSDGKITSISADERQAIEAKIDLAERTIAQLRR